MATQQLTHNFEASGLLKKSDAIDVSGIDHLSISANVTGGKDTQRFNVIVTESIDGTNYDILKDENGYAIHTTVIGNSTRNLTVSALKAAYIKVQVYSKHPYGTIVISTL